MARNLDFTGFVSSQDPRTYPTNDIRILQAQGGDQQAIIQQSGNHAADTGSQLLDLLKQYQQFGRQQEVAGQQEQTKRVFNTPSDLIGASPGLQSSVRNASVQAVEPTIGGARDLISEAKSLMTELKQEEEKNQSRADNIINLAIQTGSQSLEDLLRNSPEVFKKAGYNTKEFESVLKGLKSKEVEEKRQFDIKNAPSFSGGVSTTGTSVVSPIAQSVIDGVIRLEDLTPTVRGQIAPELAKAGFKSGPKLSSGQQDDLANMDTVAQQIQQILNYNNDRKLEGVGFGTGPLRALTTRIFGTGSEEAKNVRSLIGQIKGTIAKLRGGTSFTPNEEKLLNSYTPDINENSASAVAKLNLLLQFISNKKANTLGFAQERGVQPTSSGVTPSGLK